MRTSGVKLVAETGDYKRGMDTAADATDNAKDSIDDLARSAPKASLGMDEVGRSAKKAGRDVDSFRRDLKELDRQIALTEAEMLSLGRAFAKTGDKDALAQFTKEGGVLGQLKAVRKRIADAGDDSAGSFYSRFSGKLGNLISGLPISPQLAAVVGGAAVVAAPVLAAALSGAVIGGAGLGGIAGGLLLASKDIRVQQATQQMGDRLEKRLDKAGGAFVNPAIQGLREIETAIDSINLEQIFSDAAREVVPLAHSVGEAIKSIGDGIEDLVHNAGPVLEVIDGGIEGIGDHLGQGLSTLADNGEEAAQSLQLLFAVVNSSLDSVFGLVNGLSDIYGILNNFGLTGALPAFANTFGPGMDTAANAAQKTAVAARAAASGIDRVAGSATGAVQPVRDLDKEMSDAASAARSLYSANISAAEATANASKIISENGKALDLNTKKGRENRSALIDVANAYARQHDNAVAANGENARSAGIASRNAAQFVNLAQKAGYSASQARELARSLGLIPTRRETQLIVQSQTAEARAKRVRDLLNGLHNRTVSVNVIVAESRLNKVAKQLEGRAGGGPVQAGVPYVTGEYRPEVFTPTMDGMIHSSMAAFTRQHTAMAGGGMIREPIFGVGQSGRTYSFGEAGIPEAVTPMNRTYQPASAGMVAVTNVNHITVAPQFAAGANLAEAARQTAQLLETHLARGGEIRVNGKLLVGVP